MRVLFIYKYLTLGGVETVLRARLEGLDGFDVDAHAWFLAGGEGLGVFRGLEARVRVGGIDDLRRFLETHPQDVVSSIDTEEVLPLLRGLPDPRIVLEIHSPYLENLEYLRGLDREGIIGFLSPSEHQRAVAVERLGRGVSIRVVPNALARRFVAGPMPFRPAPPRPIVAWMGRLDLLKDWRALLTTAGLIAKEMTGVEFWMVAPSAGGRAEDELFQAASRAGVAAWLTWFQSFPHERAARLMDAVRDSGGVLLSTSRGESFGMAVAEAMARRCAVVAPALGPFPEYIVDGASGLLYSPRSPEAAAAAVVRFLRDPGLRERCGHEARESILSRHAPDRALAELADALREVHRRGEAIRPATERHKVVPIS
jgi:glycosyltransferase involved in cell wall biosynthesis